MKIRWSFDEAGVDPTDPIGNILITDGKATISEQHVYLDSWFDALMSGLKEVQAGKCLSVDLVEEPNPLVFEPQNQGMKLTYNDIVLHVQSISEFNHVLLSAAEEFVEELSEVAGISKNQLLESVAANVTRYRQTTHD